MIVSSVISRSNVQADGRFVVRETHTDDTGNIYLFDYMADRKTDQKAHLAASAAQLNAQFQYLIDNADAIAQAQVDAAQQAVVIAQNNLAAAEITLSAIEAAPLSLGALNGA